MTALRYEVRAGEMMPPWYYACAYDRPECARRVFYPIVVHLFVRFGCWIENAWNLWRSQPDARALEIRRAMSGAYDQGYLTGLRHGRGGV